MFFNDVDPSRDIIGYLGCREASLTGFFAGKMGRRGAKSRDFAAIQDQTVNKTALIVDDSRSARVVLKKVLETHELNVDTAESAEDALDYLTDHRPDVIFMDHLMPGMDGFEAVSAIKQNPDTATIPIMMYTSQEGEVYVGQARALGAVGVLPKKIAPVEVSKVLKSLRVIGGERSDTRVTGRGRHDVDQRRVCCPGDAGPGHSVAYQGSLRATASRAPTRHAGQLRGHCNPRCRRDSSRVGGRARGIPVCRRAGTVGVYTCGDHRTDRDNHGIRLALLATGTKLAGYGRRKMQRCSGPLQASARRKHRTLCR